MVLCGELWQERLGPYYTAQPSPAEKSFQHSHPQRAAGQASCDLIAHEAKVKPWGISASLWERKSFFSIPAASTPISYFLTLCLKTATLKLSCNPETIFYFTEYYPFFFFLFAPVHVILQCYHSYWLVTHHFCSCFDATCASEWIMYFSGSKIWPANNLLLVKK